MFEEKLESCPWCDENKAQQSYEVDKGKFKLIQYFFKCPICGVCGPLANTPCGARKLWNGFSKKTKEKINFN